MNDWKALIITYTRGAAVGSFHKEILREREISTDAL